MSIRVLLADDHTILRLALRVLLTREPDLEVVADASSGAEALRLAAELTPDVIVMDISMPGMDGIEATRRLVAAVPGVHVLALSTHLERHFVSQMLAAGAKGYVAKSADGEQLLQAIRTVAQNRVYLCPEVASIAAGSMGGQASDQTLEGERLEGREREVLALIGEGKSSREIASRLGIAVSTVLSHRRNIGRKLGLQSIAELTKYAIREGLIPS